MSRKPSVILSAAERKTAQYDLKHALVDAKAALRNLKLEQKLINRDVAVQEKFVLGLQTRLDALKPASKPKTENHAPIM